MLTAWISQAPCRDASLSAAKASCGLGLVTAPGEHPPCELPSPVLHPGLVAGRVCWEQGCLPVPLSLLRICCSGTEDLLAISNEFVFMLASE